MMELVAVIVVVSALTILVIAKFNAAGAPGSDASAKSALTQLVDIETTEVLLTGQPTDISAIQGRAPAVTFVTGTSADPDHVSVQVSGSVVAGAVSTGNGSCWLVRRDFAGNEAPVVWSVADSGTCSSARAMSTAVVDGRGTTIDTPVLLG